MNLAEYVAKRTKIVDALVANPQWLALCTRAGATPSRRQARKYLNYRGLVSKQAAKEQATNV